VSKNFLTRTTSSHQQLLPDKIYYAAVLQMLDCPLAVSFNTEIPRHKS